MPNTPLPGQRLNVMSVRDAFVFGGPDATLVGWWTEIDRQRFNLSLTCFDNPGNVARVLLDPAEKAGIETHLIPWGNKRLIASVRALVRLIRERKIHVLHTHDWKADLVGYIAGRITGIPVMTTVYVWFGKNSLPKVRFYEWLDRIFIKRLDLVTAISEATRRDTVALGIDAAKAIAVFSGVNLARFDISINREALRASLGIEPGELVIGYLARLYPEKAHNILVDAASLMLKEMPNLKFMFVGGGPCEQPLREQAASLGIAKSIIFTGTRRDIPELLQIFDVQSHASLAEGIPLALYEGLASSRPVVASNVDGNPEVIHHEETGLIVPPRDPQALAAALLELLRDRDKARRLGEAGRRLMEEKYAMPLVVRHLESVYTDLYRRRRGTRSGRADAGYAVRQEPV